MTVISFHAGLTKSLKLGGGPGDAVTVHFRWIFESYSNSGFFWTRKFENRAEKGIICSFFLSLVDRFVEFWRRSRAGVLIKRLLWRSQIFILPPSANFYAPWPPVNQSARGISQGQPMKPREAPNRRNVFLDWAFIDPNNFSNKTLKSRSINKMCFILTKNWLKSVLTRA